MKTAIRAAVCGFGLLLLPMTGQAACLKQSFDQKTYTVCRADPVKDRIRLFRMDDAGELIGSFGRLRDLLARQGENLIFAMNAGMYHPDRSPVGLYVEDGEQQRGAVAGASAGNFGMLPNGILCLTDGGAQIVETRAFIDGGMQCRDATQSGPMLVIGGKLHPRFLPDSTSRHIRNGVGISPDGTVVFAISDDPVTFHEFGRLFRDALGTPDALYLDGSISRLYAPELGRADLGLPMGPIVAVLGAPDR